MEEILEGNELGNTSIRMRSIDGASRSDQNESSRTNS